jgi:hypothetical protein
VWCYLIKGGNIDFDVVVTFYLNLLSEELFVTVIKMFGIIKSIVNFVCQIVQFAVLNICRSEDTLLFI